MNPQTFKIEPKWGQDGAGKVKNGAKRLNMEPKWSQRGEDLLGGPFWERKSGQHGRKIGSQIEPKSMPKSIKKTMPFKIDFWNDFGGFCDGKWKQVGTQMGSKIDLFLKTSESKNCS